MVKLNDYMIAGSADTPIEVVRDLSILGVTVIRERLAANPNTPLEILEKLALDADPVVRSAVAENSTISRKIAEQLFRDEHPDVRFCLAENLKTPMELIKRLAEDENPYIAIAAAKTLDIFYFEAMLTEEKFEVATGETAKLGELLVASSWLGEDIMLGCVRQATSQNIPLGQVLLRTGLVAPTVILLALKMQSKIRLGQVSIYDAVQKLRDHRLYSKSA